ncbi:CPBP family intramembrane glutamic endopeptidase [cf. Phormidesmis sp. LEGE 11477]|uniref:CPBP family intramembrane glutamic endopeptidase n=1 Tax=cf. Phormidesmis sp. LEGE 11477 TaxID=1828680 RepID=UPI00187FE589|nr:CPBP family intramembrane glutamic endopeptidase [cf. Phormidesmis sp. LEGE 11477]MBE9059951.1 CPBP family intramembrane metalloprotease [cf. Phormidesmis sp. LEGE 11477]
MSDAYIQLARQGRNHWWRYLLGSIVTLILSITGGTLTLGLFVAYIANDNNPNTRVLSPEAVAAGQPFIVGVSPLVLYIVYNLAFPFFLLGIYLSIRFLHRRSFRTLITPTRRISWQRISQGFIVYFLLIVVEVSISYALSPEAFTLNFQPWAFISFIPIVVVLTSLQTSTEELFFRGYLLQGIGSRFGKWLAILLPSILFMLLHLSNPEVTTQDSWEAVASLVIYYFMIGAFLAWLTIKDNGLELALGVHAANNIATFLLVTSNNSVIPSPAIFSVSKFEADFGIVILTAMSLWIFSFVVFRLLRHPQRNGRGMR